MKKQAFNPYLPSWEYIPDGEPYVFGDRVYVYGSHDYFNGHVFCLGDYVCWSAPVTDLGNWRCEGTIYRKDQDPLNREKKMCLYAPDVTVGKDGRYYLYYVLDKVQVVSVAVCDTPAGNYEFYGYVHYEDGVLLGEGESDEPQFDPAVLYENGQVYLYTGFCPGEDFSRSGPMVTVLQEDMLTISQPPRFIAPSKPFSKGSTFEGHEFFEAPSIRKINDTYYFVYSSVLMHELCYATSKSPLEGFRYGGVIVSNNDLGIDSYKDSQLPTSYGANNHGGMVKIENDWYIFYHRHTNGTWYSRQGCAEPIEILADGSIPQVEMTSLGMNRNPLSGKGEYPAYIACNLHGKDSSPYVEGPQYPKITQEGRDGDELPGYIANITDGVKIGFKYFSFDDIGRLSLKVRGYAKGCFKIMTDWSGEAIATIPIEYSNVWEEYEVPIHLCGKRTAIYLEYEGEGNASLKSISFS